MGVGAARLDLQYRCHPSIARVCIGLYYRGELRTGCAAEDRAALVPQLAPVCLVESQGAQSIDRLGSISNANEASLVTRTVHRLIEHGVDGPSIGVICYYRAQAALVRRALESGESAPSRGVMVSTVDAFQGAERDVVIISLACERPTDFINQDERLNVAVSRARHHLIVFASQAILAQSYNWGQVQRLGRADTFRGVPAPIEHARAAAGRAEAPDVAIVRTVPDPDDDACVLVDAGEAATARAPAEAPARAAPEFSTIGPRQLWEAYKSFWTGFTYGDEGARRRFLESDFGRAFLGRFEGSLPRKNLKAHYTDFFIAVRDDVSTRHGEASVRLDRMIAMHDDEAALRGTAFGDCVLEVRPRAPPVRPRMCAPRRA